MFLLTLQSVQNSFFSKPIAVQKVIEPEPLIGLRQVNTRFKDGGVLYLFGI
jgi:hypothetical protein